MNQFIKHFVLFLFVIQTYGLAAHDPSQKKVVIVPFETQNDFIIVELLLQGTLPLKFIFDTGAESTIITKKEIAQALGFKYDKRFQILGADLSQTMYANRAKNASISLDGMDVSHQTILVLEEDYFNFEEFLGLSIHGVMGMDFFRNYVIEINYRRELLTFTPKELFKPPNKKFEKIPLKISRNKPYLNTKLRISQDTILDLVFLIDTGASVSALIHNNTHPDLEIPDKTIQGNLGIGLGGAIEGYIGVIPSFGFGTFQFDDFIVNYMEMSEHQTANKRIKYNGLIGNVLLSRFHMIIDFPNHVLYLKPTKKYNKEFDFDKSGLTVIAAGRNLDHYYAQKPVKDSPTEKIDIRRGDEIIKLNGWSWRLLNLNKIYSILSKKEGKRIKIVIKRDGVKIKKEFILRKLL